MYYTLPGDFETSTVFTCSYLILGLMRPSIFSSNISIIILFSNNTLANIMLDTIIEYPIRQLHNYLFAVIIALLN